jgi:hypothetical protein
MNDLPNTHARLTGIHHFAPPPFGTQAADPAVLLDALSLPDGESRPVEPAGG